MAKLKNNIDREINKNSSLGDPIETIIQETPIEEVAQRDERVEASFNTQAGFEFNNISDTGEIEWPGAIRLYKAGPDNNPDQAFIVEKESGDFEVYLREGMTFYNATPDVTYDSQDDCFNAIRKGLIQIGLSGSGRQEILNQEGFVPESIYKEEFLAAKYAKDNGLKYEKHVYGEDASPLYRINNGLYQVSKHSNGYVAQAWNGSEYIELQKGIDTLEQALANCKESIDAKQAIVDGAAKYNCTLQSWNSELLPEQFTGKNGYAIYVKNTQFNGYIVQTEDDKYDVYAKDGQNIFRLGEGLSDVVASVVQFKDEYDSLARIKDMAKPIKLTVDLELDLTKIPETINISKVYSASSLEDKGLKGLIVHTKEGQFAIFKSTDQGYERVQYSNDEENAPQIDNALISLGITSYKDG